MLGQLWGAVCQPQAAARGPVQGRAAWPAALPWWADRQAQRHRRVTALGRASASPAPTQARPCDGRSPWHGMPRRPCRRSRACRWCSGRRPGASPHPRLAPCARSSGCLQSVSISAHACSWLRAMHAEQPLRMASRWLAVEARPLSCLKLWGSCRGADESKRPDKCHSKAFAETGGQSSLAPYHTRHVCWEINVTDDI